MGSSKGGGGQTQQTTYTPTPEEREMNKLQLEQMRAADPWMRAIQQAGLQLGGQMLRGEEMPGWMKGLAGGITPEMTNEFSQQALRDVYPQFQSSGIMDSGVAASIAARTAGDIRRASAEFNIGNKLNLLNLALSGQASIQQPVLAGSAQLGQRLAGLRTMTSTGSWYQRQGMSPFEMITGGMKAVGSLASGIGGFGTGMGWGRE